MPITFTQPFSQFFINTPIFIDYYTMPRDDNLLMVSLTFRKIDNTSITNNPVINIKYNGSLLTLVPGSNNRLPDKSSTATYYLFGTHDLNPHLLDISLLSGYNTMITIHTYANTNVSPTFAINTAGSSHIAVKGITLPQAGANPNQLVIDIIGSNNDTSTPFTTVNKTIYNTSISNNIAPTNACYVFIRDPTTQYTQYTYSTSKSTNISFATIIINPS